MVHAFCATETSFFIHCMFEASKHSAHRELDNETETLVTIVSEVSRILVASLHRFHIPSGQSVKADSAEL